MKKTLLFVGALLISAMSFGEIVVTAGGDGAKTVLSSYNNEEKAFTVSDVEFGYIGAQYNGAGSPKIKIDEVSYEPAKQSFIQLRKFAEGGNPAGAIWNNAEIGIKTITVLQQNEKNFKLSAGDAKDALAEIAKPEATTVKKTITLKDESSLEIEVHQFVFNLNGKKFFKIENVDNNTIYLHSIVIDDSATAIENAVIAPKAVKLIENGQLVIIRDGVRYNSVGQVIE